MEFNVLVGVGSAGIALVILFFYLYKNYKNATKQNAGLAKDRITTEINMFKNAWKKLKHDGGITLTKPEETRVWIGAITIVVASVVLLIIFIMGMHSLVENMFPETVDSGTINATGMTDDAIVDSIASLVTWGVFLTVGASVVSAIIQFAKNMKKDED
jgi:amino acid transporter